MVGAPVLNTNCAVGRRGTTTISMPGMKPDASLLTGNPKTALRWSVVAKRKPSSWQPNDRRSKTDEIANYSKTIGTSNGARQRSMMSVRVHPHRMSSTLELDRSIAAHEQRKLVARTCTGCGILMDAGLAPVPEGVTCLCDACEQVHHQAEQQAEADAERTRGLIRNWKRHPVAMRGAK